MEAKRLGLSTLSTSLDQFSSTFVKNAFKPLASLAQRSNLRNEQYQNVIHWAGRRDFSEFMHDCYGGTLGRDELPTLPKTAGSILGMNICSSIYARLGSIALVSLINTMWRDGSEL